MPRKSGLLGALSTLAMTAGLSLSSADMAFAEACDIIRSSHDTEFLRAISADSSSACQTVAIQRLVELAHPPSLPVFGTHDENSLAQADFDVS